MLEVTTSLSIEVPWWMVEFWSKGIPSSSKSLGMPRKARETGSTWNADFDPKLIKVC